MSTFHKIQNPQVISNAILRSDHSLFSKKLRKEKDVCFGQDCGEISTVHPCKNSGFP